MTAMLDLAPITLQRVALRQSSQNAIDADAAARQRNAALLADVGSALSLLRQKKEKVSESRRRTAHVTARRKQAAELEKLRSSLAEVHARRARAKAEFEEELRTKEEAARCKQKLTAELELERYDTIEREAVRLGVGAQVAAAASAVESNMADTMRMAADQTRQAVAAQVATQTRWLAQELPGLLEAQSERAMLALRFGGDNVESFEPPATANAPAEAVTSAAAAADTASAAAGSGAPPAAAAQSGAAGCGTGTPNPATAAAAASCTLLSPSARLTAASPIRSRRPSFGHADDSFDGRAASTASLREVPAGPTSLTAAHGALIRVAQSALEAAQRVASAARVGDAAAVNAAQSGLVAAAASALDVAGKPLGAAASAASAAAASAAAAVSSSSCATMHASQQPTPWGSQYPPLADGTAAFAPPPWPPGAAHPAAPAPPPAWLAWYFGGGYANSAAPGAMPPPPSQPSCDGPRPASAPHPSHPSESTPHSQSGAANVAASAGPYSRSSAASAFGSPHAACGPAAFAPGVARSAGGGGSASASYNDDDWCATSIEGHSHQWNAPTDAALPLGASLTASADGRSLGGSLPLSVERASLNSSLCDGAPVPTLSTQKGVQSAASRPNLSTRAKASKGFFRKASGSPANVVPTTAPMVRRSSIPSPSAGRGAGAPYQFGRAEGAPPTQPASGTPKHSSGQALPPPAITLERDRPESAGARDTVGVPALGHSSDLAALQPAAMRPDDSALDVSSGSRSQSVSAAASEHGDVLADSGGIECFVHDPMAPSSSSSFQPRLRSQPGSAPAVSLAAGGTPDSLALPLSSDARPPAPAAASVASRAPPALNSSFSGGGLRIDVQACLRASSPAPAVRATDALASGDARPVHAQQPLQGGARKHSVLSPPPAPSEPPSAAAFSVPAASLEPLPSNRRNSSPHSEGRPSGGCSGAAAAGVHHSSPLQTGSHLNAAASGCATASHGPDDVSAAGLNDQPPQQLPVVWSTRLSPAAVESSQQAKQLPPTSCDGMMGGHASSSGSLPGGPWPSHAGGVGQPSAGAHNRGQPTESRVDDVESATSMAELSEGVKRSFAVAAAAVGYGGSARADRPVAAIPLSNASSNARAGGATAIAARAPRSLSQRIMKLGASDSEASSDEMFVARGGVSASFADDDDDDF